MPAEFALIDLIISTGGPTWIEPLRITEIHCGYGVGETGDARVP